MSFHWFSSLSDSFLPVAANRHSSLAEDQKRFWHALQTEDIDTVGDVASRYPDYKTWESKDGPPLKTAQARGCFESFVELMGMGGDINTNYGGGWTPLLTALVAQDKFFLDYIIGSRPNFDAVATDDKGHSHTALQIAVDNRDIEMVRRLIEHGANPKLEIETKDGEKMSPADYARSRKQPKIADLLDLAPEVKKMYDHRYDDYLDQQVERPAVAEPVAAAVAAAVAPVAAPSPSPMK